MFKKYFIKFFHNREWQKWLIRRQIYLISHFSLSRQSFVFIHTYLCKISFDCEISSIVALTSECDSIDFERPDTKIASSHTGMKSEYLYYNVASCWCLVLVILLVVSFTHLQECMIQIICIEALMKIIFCKKYLYHS